MYRFSPDLYILCSSHSFRGGKCNLRFCRICSRILVLIDSSAQDFNWPAVLVKQSFIRQINEVIFYIPCSVQVVTQNVGFKWKNILRCQFQGSQTSTESADGAQRILLSNSKVNQKSLIPFLFSKYNQFLQP